MVLTLQQESNSQESLKQGHQIRLTAVLCLLPVFAVSGAVVLSRSDWSTPLILLLCVIAISPFVLTRLDGKFQIIGLYAISLSLLLQNSMVYRNLTGGDGWMEYQLGATTLQYGWNPAREVAHNQLIWLTIGHPITKLVTSLDLDLVLRVAHPISIAALPVAIFIIARNFFSERISIISAVLYIFLHPFFFRLSRDTRTGGALLLFALFVFCFFRILEDGSNQRRYIIAATVLALGTIGSHEAVTIMGLGMLFFAATAAFITRENKIIPVLFLVFGIATYVWYSTFASGAMFQTIVGVLYGAINGLIGSGGEVSKADTSASASLQSVTYNFIRLSVIVIFFFAVLGYLLKARSYYRYRAPPLSYLGFLGGGFAILAAAFAPIGIIGIERPIALVGLFVLPLSVYLIDRVTPHSTDVLSISLCVLLIINAGVAGAFLDERTPQPNLQRGEIEQTAGVDYFHFRSTYTTTAEIEGSRWIYYHSTPENQIYAPTGAGGFSPRILLPPEDDTTLSVDLGCQFEDGGYLYQNAYATHTGTAALRSPSYFSATHVNLNFENRTMIYTNGDSTVALTPGNERIC